MLWEYLDQPVEEHQYEHLFQDPHRPGPASEFGQALVCGQLLVRRLGQHVIGEVHIVFSCT